MSTDGELRRDGRLAGALYLVVVLAGLHCVAYVPGQVGDSLAQASAHAGMFRAGIASFLVMQVAFLLLPLALYRVLGSDSSCQCGRLTWWKLSPEMPAVF